MAASKKDACIGDRRHWADDVDPVTGHPKWQKVFDLLPNNVGE
jgi:hypothetical protein